MVHGNVLKSSYTLCTGKGDWLCYVKDIVSQWNYSGKRALLYLELKIKDLSVRWEKDFIGFYSIFIIGFFTPTSLLIYMSGVYSTINFIIFLLSWLSVLSLLYLVLKKRNQNSKVSLKKTLQNILINWKSTLRAWLFFLAVYSIFMWFFGLNVAPFLLAKYPMWIIFYLVLVSLVPTKYFFHILGSGFKLSEFSLESMEGISVYRLMAMHFGFFTGRCFLTPLVLKFGYENLNFASVKIQELINIYTEYTKRVRRLSFPEYLKQKALNSIPVVADPAYRIRYVLIPIKSPRLTLSPIIFNSKGAFQMEVSHNSIALANKWGLTNVDYVKLQLVFDNLPLDSKLKVRGLVEKLSHESLYNLPLYYSSLSSKGKYDFLSTNLKLLSLNSSKFICSARGVINYNNSALLLNNNKLESLLTFSRLIPWNNVSKNVCIPENIKIDTPILSKGVNNSLKVIDNLWNDHYINDMINNYINDLQVLPVQVEFAVSRPSYFFIWVDNLRGRVKVYNSIFQAYQESPPFSYEVFADRLVNYPYLITSREINVYNGSIFLTHGVNLPQGLNNGTPQLILTEILPDGVLKSRVMNNYRDTGFIVSKPVPIIWHDINRNGIFFTEQDVFPRYTVIYLNHDGITWWDALYNQISRPVTVRSGNDSKIFTNILACQLTYPGIRRTNFLPTLARGDSHFFLDNGINCTLAFTDLSQVEGISYVSNVSEEELQVIKSEAEVISGYMEYLDVCLGNTLSSYVELNRAAYAKWFAEKSNSLPDIFQVEEANINAKRKRATEVPEDSDIPVVKKRKVTEVPESSNPRRVTNAEGESYENFNLLAERLEALFPRAVGEIWTINDITSIQNMLNNIASETSHPYSVLVNDDTYLREALYRFNQAAVVLEEPTGSSAPSSTKQGKGKGKER